MFRSWTPLTCTIMKRTVLNWQWIGQFLSDTRFARLWGICICPARLRVNVHTHIHILQKCFSLLSVLNWRFQRSENVKQWPARDVWRAFVPTFMPTLSSVHGCICPSTAATCIDTLPHYPPPVVIGSYTEISQQCKHVYLFRDPFSHIFLCNLVFVKSCLQFYKHRNHVQLQSASLHLPSFLSEISCATSIHLVWN